MEQSENLYSFQGLWWESCSHLINQFTKEGNWRKLWCNPQQKHMFLMQQRKWSCLKRSFKGRKVSLFRTRFADGQLVKPFLLLGVETGETNCFWGGGGCVVAPWGCLCCCSFVTHVSGSTVWCHGSCAFGGGSVFERDTRTVAPSRFFSLLPPGIKNERWC